MPRPETLGPETSRGRFAFDTPVQDLTPQEFCEIFPGFTEKHVAELKQKRLGMNPKDEKPLRSFIVNVLKLPDVYRSLFVNKAMSGIIPPDTEIIINISQPESTNGKH